MPRLSLAFVAAPVAERIIGEYSHSQQRCSGANAIWINIQFLRIISAYAIIYIHLAYLFHVVHIGPAFLEILRVGNDIFVVTAGFLSAYVLRSGKITASAYLRNRMIRILPLYFLFTTLAFIIQNYAMAHHHVSLRELAMSLAFVPYGPFPVLYPTWTLYIIVEFSLVIAAFQAISMRKGIYFSSALVLAIATSGFIFQFTNPALQLYTNPILINFALGVLICEIAGSGSAWLLPRRGLVPACAAILALCVVLIVLRPFYWPQSPRILALGLPASGILFSMVMLENLELALNASWIDFLAKCSYAMYLCHWFINIMAEKAVRISGDSLQLSIVLLVLTPLAVTAASIMIYLFIEAPVTRRMVRYFR